MNIQSLLLKNECILTVFFYMVGQNQQLKQLVCQSKITWYTVKAICNAYETKIVMIIVEENINVK